MKELSIEEKAKRYDEALEKAKGMHKEGMMPERIEYIFPELKESEDERIRKTLIEYISDWKQGHWSWNSDEEFCNKAILWLEKQGEHANFRNKIQIGDKVTRNEDGVLVNLSQLNRVAKKRGEQKPAWSEEDELMCQETIDWFEKKCFPYALENDNPARESIKWLKSLKERMKGD